MVEISNVKLSKKSIIEEMQAKLVLLHKKMSQQELLDKILEFTKDHFEKVLKMSFNYKNKLLVNVTPSNTHAPTAFPKFKPNPKSKKCPKCLQRRGV